jgi:hypothetical protein
LDRSSCQRSESDEVLDTLEHWEYSNAAWVVLNMITLQIYGLLPSMQHEAASKLGNRLHG